MPINYVATGHKVAGNKAANKKSKNGSKVAASFYGRFEKAITTPTLNLKLK